MKVYRNDEPPVQFFMRLAKSIHLSQGYMGTEQEERMRLEANDPEATIFRNENQILCFASGEEPLEYAVVEDLLS